MFLITSSEFCHVSTAALPHTIKPQCTIAPKEGLRPDAPEPEETTASAEAATDAQAAASGSSTSDKKEASPSKSTKSDDIAAEKEQAKMK